MSGTVRLLLLGLGLARPYHFVAVAQLATSTHTHVEVTGTVTLIKHEPDGDLHVRVSEGTAFIVAEIMPTLRPASGVPLVRPMIGQCVRVRGVRRYDNEGGHGWAEVHPVEQLAVVPCGTRSP